MVKRSLILLALCWLGLANASDGLVTLYQNPELMVVSGPLGLITGKQHLSVILEKEMFVNFPDSNISLRLEHAKEMKQIKLEPTASPLIFTAEVQLEHAGNWQATLKIQNTFVDEAVSFPIRLFNPYQVTALVTSLSLMILGGVSLVVFKPKGVRV